MSGSEVGEPEKEREINIQINEVMDLVHSDAEDKAIKISDDMKEAVSIGAIKSSRDMEEAVSIGATVSTIPTTQYRGKHVLHMSISLCFDPFFPHWPAFVICRNLQRRSEMDE